MRKPLASICIACMSVLMSVSPAPAADPPSDTQHAPELAGKANQLFWLRNFGQAEKILDELLDTHELTRQNKARCYINSAICNAQMNSPGAAKKLALQALKLVEPGSMNEADALAVEASCLSLEGKASDSRELYEKALSIAQKKLGDWNCDLSPFYEGLGASCVRTRDLQAAKAMYIKLAQLDLLKYGPDDTHLAWSLLTLSTVLDGLDEKDLSETMYKKVFWNFRHQNEERIIAEAGGQPSAAFRESLIQQLYGVNGGYADREAGLDYIRTGIPKQALKERKTRPHDFNNWFQERVGREAAPGLAFFDPNVPLKGLILAIHGLGLSHNAYTPFARRVQHDGFGVVAFDVRGFGTYRNDPLYQLANFDDIISDLARILTALRRDYKSVPIYILGESMGGAIALKIAATVPELVDGVVSSVPSGARFHAQSTELDVAMKLFKDKYAQFDIGHRIVQQATDDPDLRKAWEDDPSFRMKLSAVELLNFQRFMDDNIKVASKIESLPVIIFQGYSDQLVKPLGTLELYQSIKSKDKDLIFIGHAEHLIFEEDQFDSNVVDGLIAWLNQHVQLARNAKPAATN